MADPYNRERMLRNKYCGLINIADEMALCLYEFVKLIQEAGGDAETERELLDRFNQIKECHDR
jgi:hypothetical protein